jgi:hypothetical protein
MKTLNMRLPGRKLSLVMFLLIDDDRDSEEEFLDLKAEALVDRAKPPHGL